MLEYSLEDPHTFARDRAYAPPMHEGYALFIGERRDYTRPIVVAIYSIFTVIGVLDHQNLLPRSILPYLRTFSVPFSVIISIPNNPEVPPKPALLTIVASILIVWYSFQYRIMRLDCDDLVTCSLLVSSMLCLIVSLLLTGYLIRINWKEARSLLW